jgi:hypothetical protein
VEAAQQTSIGQSKMLTKEVPSAIMWFTKVLKKEDRVLVCSFVDREIVSIIQHMCRKCRENKQIDLPELLSVGFQYK